MGTWLTPTERGRGSMLLDGGAPLGTALGAVIIAGLIAFSTRRMAFVVAGVGTMVVGLLARWYIRTYPSEHPSINKAELDHITAANGAETSSKKYRLADIKPYLKQRNVIALIGGWVCYSFVFYGLMTAATLLSGHLRFRYQIDGWSNGADLLAVFCRPTDRRLHYG